jgi:hypothetical protein
MYASNNSRLPPHRGKCRKAKPGLGKIRRNFPDGRSDWVKTANRAISCGGGHGYTGADGQPKSGTLCEFSKPVGEYSANVFTSFMRTEGVEIDALPITAMSDYICGCYQGHNTGEHSGSRESWHHKGFWTYRFGGPDTIGHGPNPEFVLDRPSWSTPSSNLVRKQKPGYVMWYDRDYDRFEAKCTSLSQLGRNEAGRRTMIREGKVKACGHNDASCDQFVSTRLATVTCSLSGTGLGSMQGRTGTCEWSSPPAGVHVRRFEMRTGTNTNATVSADDLARYACGSYRPTGEVRYTGDHPQNESWTPSGNVWTYDK